MDYRLAIALDITDDHIADQGRLQGFEVGLKILNIVVNGDPRFPNSRQKLSRSSFNDAVPDFLFVAEMMAISSLVRSCQTLT